jgi:hypothetical protein
MMLQTYKARLHGTHIEWLGEIPSDLHDGQDVHITLLEEDSAVVQKAPSSQGQQMAILLKELAALNIASIEDPMAWQRDLRTDKPLADRDES